MKNLLYLLSISTLFATLSACSKNDNLDVWREANTNAYNAITRNLNYQALQTKTGPAGVYYKVIKSGTGTEYPLQTSNVKVFYKGMYYDGTVFDAGTNENETPAEFSLVGQSTIRGFSFALQNMVVGDKWEIWIPYYLGYGANGYKITTNYYTGAYQTMIEGYSTLVFEVEMVSITMYP